MCYDWEELHVGIAEQKVRVAHGIIFWFGRITPPFPISASSRYQAALEHVSRYLVTAAILLPSSLPSAHRMVLCFSLKEPATSEPVIEPILDNRLSVYTQRYLLKVGTSLRN